KGPRGAPPPPGEKPFGDRPLEVLGFSRLLACGCGMAENYSNSPYCTIADPARTPMPRQEILSPGQHAQLSMLPTDARQIGECYTFSLADLDLIAQCRGDQNRLGFAVQLGFLRYPGRAWTPAE